MRRTTAEPTIRPSATGASMPHVLGRADAEADADRQRRLLAQPADVVDEALRQLRAARR